MAQPPQKLIRQSLFPFRLIIYIAIVLLMSNLNALVDLIFHPDIPYFDEEHLIVGGVSATICILLFFILENYFRALSRAAGKIQQIESFLSLCASCKKVRVPGEDPENRESWQHIENYISHKTATQFSHGICPDCLENLYSDLEERGAGSNIT